MKLSAINRLIKNGESETLEFKKSTAQLKRAFETVCAFLNGEGGFVLIGVDDAGKVVGQNITDKTRKEIALELGKLEPIHELDVQYISCKEDNKFIILIEASKAPHAPYLYDGRAYQRHQSTTVRMSQLRYEQLLSNRKSLNYSWEALPAEDYKIVDLDHEEIHRTVSVGVRENRIPAIAHQEKTEILLRRLKLISPEGILKRAAIVLYARQESLNFLQCTLKMARFIGRDNLDGYSDNKQVTGHAFYLLEEADAFLRRHLSIASTFKPDQFKRIDKPTLPVFAAREALINAICHRDYDCNSNVTLAVFDDRVEIWNSGTLPNRLKLADLKKKHDSFPRNTLIANVLYSCGLIEAWGTGTNRMVDLCVEENVPRPIFRERSKGFLVIFRFKTPFGSAEPAYSFNKKILNERQQKILAIIKKHQSVHYQQIKDELAGIIADRTLQRDLNDLKKIGLIQLTGYGRSAQWSLFTHEISD